MLPVITIVGQKNVGKSTLFNKLTRTHDALISNYPGLTRDRQYGYMLYKQCKCILVDTGGIDELYNIHIESIENHVTYQTTLAIKEADIVLFMMDRQSVESSINYDIVNFLKKLKKIIFVIINKIDDIPYHIHTMIWDYYSFGIKNVIFISAIHGHGMDNLLEKISSFVSKNIFFHRNNTSEINVNNVIYHSNIGSFWDKTDPTITLAVVGRPNSGKSTFVNHMLGKNRMITCSTPGTTRNCVYVPIIYNDQQYILVDTAGVRKRKKIKNTAEQISIVKTLQIIKTVPLLLFIGDVNVGISDQDLSLLRFIVNNGKSLIIVFNKWDKISPNLRNKTKNELYEKINFVNFTQIYFISALYGNGMKTLFQSIEKTYPFFRATKIINTARLIRIMHAAISKYPPPFLYGSRIKPKYVHIGKHEPLTLIIHGTHVSKLPVDYKRYLKNYFYCMLNIPGVLLHVRFKDTINPFLNK